MKKLAKTIGLFTNRKDIINPTIQQLKTELLSYLLETTIIKHVIIHFKNKQILSFDGLVGDQKCQTRASMIQDLFFDQQVFLQDIETIQKPLSLLTEHIQNILEKFNVINYRQIKEKILTKQYIYISEFIEEAEISLKISEQLKFMSLCFLLTLSKKDIHNLIFNKISNHQINKLIELAKIELCNLSIQYEQTLALNYSSEEEQLILNQIELKKYASGYSSMTGFFPSFKVILHKMKKEKQYFLKNLLIFCLCGGIQKKTTKLFQWQDKSFKEILNTLNSKEIVMTLECYQFPSSFNKLKDLLGISDSRKTIISKEYHRPCLCLKPSTESNIKNIEESIKAVFAQHPQFSNLSELDFKKFGLLNSKLKKEYEYLKTIPGCSIEDMSNFLITHVYASTIEEACKSEISQKSNE